MAGLPWIQLATDWKGHKKAVRLRVFLPDEWAWAYVVSLWLWTAQHAGDGLIEGPGTAEVIADAAGWKGNSAAFVDACVRAELLDETSNGYKVHDWQDYAGAHIDKRERERDRLRTYRERTRTKRVRSAHVHGEREREREKETEKKKLLSQPRTEPVVASPEAAPPEAPPTPVNGGGVKTEPAPPLSPRQQGALDRETALPPRGEEYPRLGALRAALASTGLPLSWPRSRTTLGALERSLVALPLARAVEVVQAAHAANPHTSLGWYAEDLYRASVVPPPKPNGAADRWWERLGPDVRERFLAERQALDPELTVEAPFPATGIARAGEVRALIARYTGGGV